MLNLDIGKELSGGHIVHGRVGDNKSYTEKISVINEDGSPFDLTGLTITFMGNTHNFQTKVIDSDGAALNDAEKGLFQYTFPSEAFGVAGPYERAYFQFTNKNGVVATTGDFEVIVLDNADLNASEAETVISEFNKLIEELQKLQEENIADLKQQQDDYVVELSQAFAGIQTDLITLEGKINSYEASINETATEVQGTISGAVAEALDTVSQALDDFQNGNFWTKEESFNKEESSANVIDTIGGATSTIFKDEMLVNGVEAVASRNNNGTLEPFSQADYDDLDNSDKYVRSETLLNGRGAAIDCEFPVIEILEKRHPWMFKNTSTLTEKIQTYLSYNPTFKIPFAARGRGILTSNNVESSRSMMHQKRKNGSWIGVTSGTSTNMTSNFVTYGNEGWGKTHFDEVLSDGNYTFRVCSKNNDITAAGSISDGVTPAWVELRDIKLIVEFEANGRTVVESIVATYSGENIDTSFMKISSLANGADDWNNYTEIGTYGITVGTGANAPVNSTGTLLVQGYGAGGTSRTQLFINSNSIRYRQYQGGGNWTTWQVLSNIGQTDNKYMNINTTLVKAQDWNTLDTVGTYSVEGANGDNRPSINDTWGTLLVQSSKHSSSMLTQLFISSGNIYFRCKSGEATWGPWRTPIPEIASGAEIDTGTNNTKMVTPQGLATSYYSKYIAIGAWTTLTLNTGFKSADSTTVKYRILEYPQPNGAVKKKIEFDGAWTNDAGSLGSSSETQLQWCILPENLRPAQTKMFPAQCSKFSTTGRIAFTPNGICYGAQDSGAAVTYMYVTGMSYWIGE